MEFETYPTDTTSGVPDKEFTVKPPKLPEGYRLVIQPFSNYVRLAVVSELGAEETVTLHYSSHPDIEAEVDKRLRGFEKQFATMVEAQALAARLAPPLPTPPAPKPPFPWAQLIAIWGFAVFAFLAVFVSPWFALGAIFAAFLGAWFW